MVARLDEATHGRWTFEVDYYECFEDETVVMGRLTLEDRIRVAFGGTQVNGATPMAERFRLASLDALVKAAARGRPTALTTKWIARSAGRMESEGLTSSWNGRPLGHGACSSAARGCWRKAPWQYRAAGKPRARPGPVARVRGRRSTATPLWRPAHNAKYPHRYVKGTPAAHRPVSLAFGTAVHAALATFYEGLMNGRRLPVDEVQAAFADRWSVELQDDLPLLFDEGQADGDVKDQGVALLGAFMQQGFMPEHVLAVELPFQVDLPDPDTGEVLDIDLVGAIDLVAVHQGRTIICEHKTAARRFAEDRLLYDFQPTAYLYAARHLRLPPDPTAIFQVLLNTKKPAVDVIPVNRTAPAQMEMLKTFRDVLKGIAAGAFPRNRGWACAVCEFKKACC